ncbi:hypothetical protein FRB99_003408 [Tulasnella sp. 403]|nr:hypothetical protein FRB99_003408 [Tulasnella sp. 403]
MSSDNLLPQGVSITSSPASSTPAADPSQSTQSGYNGVTTSSSPAYIYPSVLIFVSILIVVYMLRIVVTRRRSAAAAARRQQEVAAKPKYSASNKPKMHEVYLQWDEPALEMPSTEQKASWVTMAPVSTVLVHPVSPPEPVPELGVTRRFHCTIFQRSNVPARRRRSEVKASVVNQDDESSKIPGAVESSDIITTSFLIAMPSPRRHLHCSATDPGEEKGADGVVKPSDEQHHWEDDMPELMIGCVEMRSQVPFNAF